MNTIDIKRCQWVSNDPVYVKYHDEEWGKPENDKIKLFEMICLEGQQAGLSWITILKKRNAYREAFCDFDPFKISQLTDNDVAHIISNFNIVRHKKKIESIINNAKCFLKMEENGEKFNDFVWGFVNNKSIINNWASQEDIPTQTPISMQLSQELKRRGFKFVGPTVCYSFMQACGLINDHLIDCCSYNKYLH